MAVIEVALFTVKLVAATPSKVTAVAPVKLVPVIVTLLPPAVLPVAGLTLVTVGGATYVKSVFAAFTPPGVVTRMLAVPAGRDGVVQVIVVESTTTRFEADDPPKVTAVAPVKFVPVIVTLVPPEVLPVAGLTLVTVGGAAYVKSVFAAFVP